MIQNISSSVVLLPSLEMHLSLSEITNQSLEEGLNAVNKACVHIAHTLSTFTAYHIAAVLHVSVLLAETT